MKWQPESSNNKSPEAGENHSQVFRLSKEEEIALLKPGGGSY